MTTRSCLVTSHLIPGAAILMQVFQHIESTPFSSVMASFFIPGAAILMRVLERIKMTI